MTEYSMNTNPAAPITQDEARASLQEIDRTIAQMRKAIASGCAAPLLIIWGINWIIGFSSLQYLPQSARMIGWCSILRG